MSSTPRRVRTWSTRVSPASREDAVLRSSVASRTESTVGRRMLAAALVGVLGVGAVALAAHRPPTDPPPPPTGPNDPGGGGGNGGGGGGGGSGDLPPTTPGGGGLTGMMARLDALAIVDQFPPAAVAEFEGLFFGWVEFISSNDGVMPFDEWLWANGVEDPEEFEMFMTLYLLLVKMRA